MTTSKKTVKKPYKPKRYTTQQVIKAIRGGYEDADGRIVQGSAGIISTIAKRIGADWHTISERIKADKEVALAYQDEVERTLDAAEAAVLGSIAQGDTNDAKWYLTKKGKIRGYGDMTDVVLSGEVTIKVVRTNSNPDHENYSVQKKPTKKKGLVGTDSQTPRAA